LSRPKAVNFGNQSRNILEKGGFSQSAKKENF